MGKHVSCKRCGLIWHEKDLDKDGLCPECQGQPEPEKAADDEEGT
jgi:predicted Zn-ribbon and HTH transcriptional regulator